LGTISLDSSPQPFRRAFGDRRALKRRDNTPLEVWQV
jgi:hypothetical protein